MISPYCQECCKFTQKQCLGKEASQKSFTYWGLIIKQHKSGLSFCHDYEFDDQFYVFSDGKNGDPETIVQAIKRGKQKQAKESSQENSSDFDTGTKLSSADFADLMV